MEEDSARNKNAEVQAISDVVHALPLRDATTAAHVEEGHGVPIALMERQQGAQCLMHSVNNVLHAFASLKV